LSDADTEAAETEVWLDFAFHCKYLDETDYAKLRDRYDHICRMLSRMMAKPNKWAIQAKG
jgi:four helix bundle protein